MLLTLMCPLSSLVNELKAEYSGTYLKSQHLGEWGKMFEFEASLGYVGRLCFIYYIDKC